jgi:hypothetical protein
MTAYLHRSTTPQVVFLPSSTFDVEVGDSPLMVDRVLYLIAPAGDLALIEAV